MEKKITTKKEAEQEYLRLKAVEKENWCKAWVQPLEYKVFNLRLRAMTLQDTVNLIASRNLHMIGGTPTVEDSRQFLEYLCLDKPTAQDGQRLAITHELAVKDIQDYIDLMYWRGSIYFSKEGDTKFVAIANDTAYYVVRASKVMAMQEALNLPLPRLWQILDVLGQQDSMEDNYSTKSEAFRRKAVQDIQRRKIK